DYCLFLINRFRDELAHRNNPRQSVRFAVKNVSEVITSSAGTVMAGFLAMATAQLGLFNTTGPTLAIGVVIGLLAGLTLTPAMLGLLGQWAFWPGKARHRQTGALYRRTSQWVSTRPLLTIGFIILIMTPFAIYGSGQQASYDTLADLPQEIASVEGFRLMETHLGAGNLQPLTIVTELESENASVEQVTQALQQVRGVAVVRSASQPFGIPQEMNEMLAATYLNPETGAARFEVVLQDNPYSLEAMDTTLRLRETLKRIPGQDAIVGATSIQADLRDILAEDMQQTMLLVLVGIFLVLLLMLRSVVAPLYLIGTILLSYGTTLGITRLVSDVLWGTDDLTWWVPFFMFVFLVALGIDYSIFLFGRIKEEVSRYGIQEGIHHAVEATGSVITSAGIIVAGTFGAMIGGDIMGLAQIGFAVSVGILI
ncbi:MAG: MMPL family transporter, partial [Anaerolineae bacterium]|nr:MMPL family transporter [Anaerolineae bacterium]